MQNFWQINQGSKRQSIKEKLNKSHGQTNTHNIKWLHILKSGQKLEVGAKIFDFNILMFLDFNIEVLHLIPEAQSF